MSLTLLIKPVSSNCQMQCKYCFYTDVAGARALKKPTMMSLTLLETLLKKVLSEAKGHCTLIFQGGEPTLAGLDFYRKLIELENIHNTSLVKINHALQTNGLAITPEWADFLAENNFLVGLSIDGDKNIHDHLRVDASFNGTHNRCLKAAALLRSRKAAFNILSVVTNQLAKHPQRIYNFYKKQGFQYIQFIPCINGFGDNQPLDFALNPQTYGDFLCSLFDLWAADLAKGQYYSIRLFDNYIHMLRNGGYPDSCAMAGHCSAYPVVEADGSVYPCDFYALDGYQLGTVQKDSFKSMLGSEEAKEFMDCSKPAHLECQTCQYYFICRGGCRRDREPLVNGRLSKNRFCQSYQIFFGHALARMQTIAWQFGS